VHPRELGDAVDQGVIDAAAHAAVIEVDPMHRQTGPFQRLDLLDA
jgi:hypothetical protein